MTSLPEDIILHMIKCTNYPKSHYYLLLIYKRMFNKSLPLIDVKHIIDDFRERYNNLDTYIGQIYNENDESIATIKEINNNKQLIYVDYYVDMDSVKYSSSIFEYDISLDFIIDDYDDFSLSHFINHNKQIKKLTFNESLDSFKNSGIINNLAYYLKDVDFKQQFPNVEELHIDFILLYNIDYNNIIGSIKKITLIISYLELSDITLFNIFKDVCEKKHPNIIYELDIKIISEEVYLNFLYNNFIPLINAYNISLKIAIRINTFLNNRNHNILMDNVLVMTMYTLPSSIDKQYKEIIIDEYTKLKVLIIKTDQTIKKLIISNCPNLEYIAFNKSKNVKKLILNNLPSLICLDIDDKVKDIDYGDVLTNVV